LGKDWDAWKSFAAFSICPTSPRICSPRARRTWRNSAGPCTSTASYAQLRNANYLSGEIKDLDTDLEAKQQSGTTGQIRDLEYRLDKAAKALLQTARSAIGYGQDALEALKSHADPVAYTTPQPIRHLTEDEKAALGN
jgi:hypothetical protein